MRAIRILLLFLVVGLMVALAGGPALGAPRDQALRYINERRFGHGCERLIAAEGSLLRDARAHSRTMAGAGEPFHSRLDAGRWSKVGEVVGTADRWGTIVDELFVSVPHRHILLDCDYDRIALGFAWRDRTWLTGRLYAS